MRLAAMAFALALCAGAAPTEAQQPTAARWRPYDVNNDRRFDEADMRLIAQQGIWHPSIDANGDGAKDINDSWKLALDKTALDRNADGVVDAKDAVQAPAVVLPANAAADIPRLVQSLLQEHAAALPALQQQKLREMVPYLRSTDRDTLSYGYLQAGALVLLKDGNLDGATWLYAKAVEATPDSAGPLAALGYALIEQDDLSAALVALARAHRQKPLLCFVNTNVGALHTRLGRPDQAIPFYREAVRQCPRSSIDYRNLASALLRAGHAAEAKLQYEKAARLDPRDAEATLMSMATNPPTINADAARAGAYESLRSSHENWRDRAPWSALEPEDKVSAMLEMTELPAQRELDRQWTRIINEANAKIEDAAKEALPLGKDMCTDLQRWMANVTKANDRVIAIARQAADETAAAAVYANQRIAGQQLSLNSLLHQQAVTVATQRRALYGGNVYEETLDQLWREPMHNAQQRLHTKEQLPPGEGVPELVAQEAITALWTAFMGITTGSLDPTYAGEGKCMQGKPPEPPQYQGDLAVGLSAGIVSIEFKPRTCEIKITEGEGLIAYQTWSPASGFSIAGGVGFKTPTGFPVDLGASQVLKFGSDGSVVLETSGQMGEGFVSYGVDATETLVPKQHEPTGTNDWIKGIAKDLGCDVS